jgi:aminoglycoside 6'-N-acetyltransferase I
MDKRIELLSFDPERDTALYIEGELSVFQETFPGLSPSREVLQTAHDIVDGLVDSELQDACTAVVDGEAAGFIILSVQSFYGMPLAMVDSLYVAPSFRGLSLGKIMLEFAEDWSRAQGAKSLRIDVANSNQVARELYAAAGYADTRAQMEKWIAR